MADINGLSGIKLTGLSTGIDTDSIISKLVELSKKRIDQLKSRETEITSRQNAVKRVENTLIALQAANAKLAKAFNGAFDGKSAKSSDESYVVAAAGSAAIAGVTSFRVQSLARNHQLASQGFESASSEITQGTFSIRSGEKSADITIDSTNNTVQGLVRAIANANIGVTANIVNDGSGVQPYRIILSSNNSGSANAISITNSLASDSGSSSVRKVEFGGTYIGHAVTPTDLGTSAVTTNVGTGNFTGTANKVYTFTVASGGTVGSDTIQLQYADSTGTQSGTVTVNAADTSVAVAEGLTISLGAGTLTAGKSFSVGAYVSTIQSASDAVLQIGSGAGAINVRSSSNQVQNVIPGVTLSLKNADASKEVQITVSNDVSTAKAAISDFVKAYNDFVGLVDDQSKIDGATGRAGLLARSRAVLDLRTAVQQSVLSSSSYLPTTINRLSAIGITLGRDGKLTTDETKVDDALNGRLSGVLFGDVKRLFAITGTSNRGEIEFIGGTSKTKESGSAYQVRITQASTQGTISATNALASSVTINSSNNTLTLSVNGTTSGTITLASGTYNQSQLASELESRINSDTTLGGRKVSVSLSGQKIVVTSLVYGSASSIGAISGTAASSLGFAGTEVGTTGQNVAGYFTVGGLVEAATGSGQVLTGNSGNSNTEGLAIKSTVAASQIGAGFDGEIQLTRGVSSRFQLLVDSLLDVNTGRLKSAHSSLQLELDAAKSTTERESKSLDARQASLLRQFQAMETAVARYRRLGDSLTSQLASLQNSIGNRS